MAPGGRNFPPSTKVKVNFFSFSWPLGHCSKKSTTIFKKCWEIKSLSKNSFFAHFQGGRSLPFSNPCYPRVAHNRCPALGHILVNFGQNRPGSSLNHSLGVFSAPFFTGGGGTVGGSPKFFPKSVVPRPTDIADGASMQSSYACQRYCDAKGW